MRPARHVPTISEVVSLPFVFEVAASPGGEGIAYAAQTAARGSAIATVDALNMVLVAVLVFLLMRQIMPIAAALAGGMALSSFGAVSRLVGWGMRRGAGATVAAAGVAATSLGMQAQAPLQRLMVQRATWRMS